MKDCKNCKYRETTPCFICDECIRNPSRFDNWKERNLQENDL